MEKDKEKLDIDLIKTAYKALKQSLYYDKSNSNISLRQRLIKFESDKKFEDNLNNLLVNLESTNTSNEYFSNLIREISLYITPKKISLPKDNTKKSNFISNNVMTDDSYKIDRLSIFIDCPIELHIITVLWIYFIGQKIDSKMSSSIYGNRLNFNNTKLNKLSLYKPYYSQYSKWRDDAIESARFIVEKQKKDTAILTLDIKDYYYSIAVEKAKLKNSLISKECGKEDTFDDLDNHEKDIHYLFEKIHEKYTEKLAKINYPEDNNISSIDLSTHFSLPIGLLSSYVIANWYLNDFDEIVENKIKPHYYGRYVDDIILVFKEPIMSDDCFCCEPENCIREKYDNLNGMSIISKFIVNHFHEAIKVEPIEDNEKDDKENDQKDKIKYILKLNPRKEKFPNTPKLIVQDKKVFLYFFNHLEPISVLDKLKKDIDIATSEFRFFNDFYLGKENFEDKVYELQYDGSSRKIITLKDYKVNDFSLSVFLAKKIQNLQYYNEKSKNELQKISKFFKGRNILEYSKHWERYITFLLLSEEYLEILNFLAESYCEFSKIKTLSISNINIEDIHKNLRSKLYWSFITAISLNPHKILLKTNFKDFVSGLKELPNSNKVNYQRIERVLESFCDDHFNPKEDVIACRKSNMIRHNLILNPLLNYTKYYHSPLDNNIFINLLEKKWTFNFNKDEISELDLFNNHLLEYSPRLISHHELSLFKLKYDITKYFVDNQSKSNSDKKFQRESYNSFENSLSDPNKKKYLKKTNIIIDNFDPGNLGDIILNSKHKKDNLRIAISNYEVKEKYFVERLKGNSVLSEKRFTSITKCLDIANKENADMIVFPEWTVPIEYLPLLSKYAMHRQIAIVFGMEHVVQNDFSFNFCVTILPYQDDSIKDSVCIFRLKNYYAPLEIEHVEGYGLKVPKPVSYKYDRFNFKGAYFSLLYCFELANITDRSLLKSKVDFVVCSEFNKDINYFSNIIESSVRDLHCYFVQCNTRQFGDNRITAPKNSENKDIVKIKGGSSDTVVIAEIDIKALREFQLKQYNLQLQDKEFKPTPPHFNRKEVKKE